MGLHCFVTRHSLALCCAVLRCWAVLRQHVPCVDPIRAECPPDAEVLASRLGSPEQPREVRTMLGYPGALPPQVSRGSRDPGRVPRVTHPLDS